MHRGRFPGVQGAARDDIFGLDPASRARYALRPWNHDHRVGREISRTAVRALRPLGQRWKIRRPRGSSPEL